MLTGGVGEHVEDLVLDVFQRFLVVRDVDHLRNKKATNQRQSEPCGVSTIDAIVLTMFDICRNGTPTADFYEFGASRPQTLLRSFP